MAHSGIFRAQKKIQPFVFNSCDPGLREIFKNIRACRSGLLDSKDERDELSPGRAQPAESVNFAKAHFVC